MNLKVEWSKIITNAISTLVVAVFVGAGAIVWEGATSVDAKVQTNKENMTFLIEALSDKLATYEVQMSSLSNQLAVIIRNQSDPVVMFGNKFFEGPLPDPSQISFITNTNDSINAGFKHRAFSQDIRQQLIK
jgi:hypothetical protein